MRSRFKKEPNFLPLLDIVFILLFFFMFSLVISNDMEQLKISLPKHKVEKPVGNDKKIVIQLLGNLSVIFKGKLYHNISDALNDIRSANADEIYLAADGELAYRYVLNVMADLKDNGIVTIHLLYKQKRPSR